MGRIAAAAALAGLTIAPAAGLPAGQEPSVAVEIAALSHTICMDTPDKVATFTAIVLAESGGDPSIHGDTTITDGTWGDSIGLAQIRSIWAQEGTGQARDASRLEDPVFNIRSACEISSGGTNWRPWSMWLNGGYEAYLPEARQAAEAVTGGKVNVSYTPTAAHGPAAGPAAAPARQPDRSPGNAARRLWDWIIGGWVRLGQHATGEQHDRWEKVDRTLFGP